MVSLAGIAAAVADMQPDNRRAAYKDYNRSARLRCVATGNMEQPPRRNAGFISVCRDTMYSQKVISSVASASEDSIFGVIFIHSFIHSVQPCVEAK